MDALSYSNSILQNKEGTLNVFIAEGFLILEVWHIPDILCKKTEWW